MSALPTWLREILRCPVCHGELTDEPGPVLRCAGTCEAEGRPSRYRVADGIPVLLPEEARRA